MKATIFSIAIAGVFAGAVCPALAADSPWNGTWKIDYSKSQLTGQTFSYSSVAGGKMQYSNGSADVYTFACDGKPYPTIPGSTVTCSQAASGAYSFSYATNGKTTTTTTTTISADGNSLGEVQLVTYPDGTTRTINTTSSRVGTGTGLAGTWKSVKTSSNSPTLFTLSATPTTVTYTSKLSGATVAINLDGTTQAALTGPNVPPNLFLIGKAAGASEVDFTEMIAGKDAYEATWVLSSDGTTLTWTGWAHGKKDEATVAVYEKQ